MKNKLMTAVSCLSLFAAFLALTPMDAHTIRHIDRPENMTEEEFAIKAEQKYARDLAEQEAIENAVDDEEVLGELKVSDSDLAPLSNFTLNTDIVKFPTTHTGAWHKAIAVSATGNHVTLEDGSGWLVYPNDKKKTLDWYGDDIILVTMA
ncbi:MAG: hypothetical protein H0W50_05280, partial [Parachlamydiaceae bacterium]|nr:hypothetical protein [Parachlamydiaceae bacterium]